MSKLTLWRDPIDGGLRAEPGEWRSPKDAYEKRRYLFQRVGVGSAYERQILAAAGDALPQAPGEWSVITLTDPTTPAPRGA